MTSDLTAQAVLEFPEIFKIEAERKPGTQVLSVERTPVGIIVEVITDVSGTKYQVLTSNEFIEPSTAERHAGEPVAIYVDSKPRGVHSWERTPPDGPWEVSFRPTSGLVVRVVTPQENPPAEVRLSQTTVVEELPASYRP